MKKQYQSPATKAVKVETVVLNQASVHTVSGNADIEYEGASDINDPGSIVARGRSTSIWDDNDEE